MELCMTTGTVLSYMYDTYRIGCFHKLEGKQSLCKRARDGDMPPRGGTKTLLECRA